MDYFPHCCKFSLENYSAVSIFELRQTTDKGGVGFHSCLKAQVLSQYMPRGQYIIIFILKV